MITLNGFEIHKGRLDPAAQARLARRGRRRRRRRAVLRAAHPLGQADERAHDLRRQIRLVHRREGLPLHRPPPLRRPLAADPGDRARALARARLASTATPDCCLVNHYGAKARMGLHRDADEADFSWPVLSISLGDPGLFRVGGPARSDPTASILLESGDVVVLRRRRAPRLPRHRPHPLRRLAAAAGGRAHQPDAAGGGLNKPRPGKLARIGMDGLFRGNRADSYNGGASYSESRRLWRVLAPRSLTIG